MFKKHSLVAVLLSLLAISFLLTACGSSGSPTTSGDVPSAHAPATPTAPATSVPTATPTFDNSSAFIKTITIQNDVVLTDTHGRTLYYRPFDRSTEPACIGSCTKNWQPLLYQGSGAPTSSTQLPGTLSVVTTPSGPQVEYQKYALFTFVYDTGPGMVNGMLEGDTEGWAFAVINLGVNPY